MNSPNGSDLVSASSSKPKIETVNGSHNFVIKGYSLIKGIGAGNYIASENFTIAGYQFAIYFFPDGDVPQNSTYVSLFIGLASQHTDVQALFEVTLVNQSGSGKHKAHSLFDGSLGSEPFTLKAKDSRWGFPQFMKRDELEASNFLKDDCLKINCTVGVLISSIDCSELDIVQIPESNIGEDFGTLLEMEEGWDVTFSVLGKKFHAHKLILGARSSVFEAEFFNGMEENKQEIVVTDMDPKVFKALLHFIYRDTLIEDEELLMSCSSSSSSSSSVFDLVAAKLLAAAEKYDLPRLKLLCESVLCNVISVDSVAYLLTLADQYYAIELKRTCLQFFAQNFAAVIKSEGFGYLKKNHPLLLSELLKRVAGRDFYYVEETCARNAIEQTWQNERRKNLWFDLPDEDDNSRRSPEAES